MDAANSQVHHMHDLQITRYDVLQLKINNVNSDVLGMSLAQQTLPLMPVPCFTWPQDIEAMPLFVVAMHFLTLTLPCLPLELTDNGDLKTVDVAVIDCRWFSSDGDPGAVELFNDVELEVPALKAEALPDRASGSLWPVSYLLLNLL
jgi:hypothetical protein